MLWSTHWICIPYLLEPWHKGSQFAWEIICEVRKTNHLPWRSIHRDWLGGLCSGYSCRFDDSSAGKPGTFLILSFLPFLLVAPHSAQGWHLKNYNFAELADKRNTGICKQKPLLFWSVCGTFHTNDRRETVTTCRRKEQKVTSFTEAP